MAYDLSKLGLLMVEDSAHMRALVRRLLDAYGLTRIEEASDGHDAFDVLDRTSVDIALIDYQMAPMDGIEFTRQLRGDRMSPAPYLPIIMMTGYTEKHRVIEARDAGVTELIAKPVSALGLYNRLIAVIERPRPFVRAPGFFGPDRRRRQLPLKGPDRRGRTDRTAAKTFRNGDDYLDI